MSVSPPYVAPRPPPLATPARRSMAGSGAGVLALLSLLAPALSAQHALYTTTLEKSAGGVSDAASVRTSSFTIPSGQCSGLIDKSLLCGGGAAAAVRVAVRDAAYATLRIDDALRGATVTRARCERAADVELRVTCRPTVARHEPDLLEPARGA